MKESYSLVKLVEHAMTECLRRDKMKSYYDNQCKICSVELRNNNTSVESIAGNKCLECYIKVMNHFHSKINSKLTLNASDINIANLNVTKPDEELINWDPKEYRIMYVDLEKGEMKLERK
jgi:hypothetical protein